MKEKRFEHEINLFGEDPEKEMEEFFKEVEVRTAREFLKEEDYLPKLPCLDEALEELPKRREENPWKP